jgi:phosphatidylglycerophosphatase B
MSFLSFTQINSIRPLIYISLVTLALLVIIVGLTPLAFTACSTDSLWCRLAYYATTSGGPVGFSILLLLTAFSYALNKPGKRQKIMTFFRTAITLAAFFMLLALINERYTKHFLKLQRPSHRYMLSQTGRLNEIDSLYQLDKETRRQFFNDLTSGNAERFIKIDKSVIAHWVEEAGYSFPSGHSFNAFLFATIIGYSIWFTRSKPKYRWLYFLPFLWALLVAVSRVAMGAHTALDVCAGALLGTAIGLFFLWIDLTRSWLTSKDHKP